MTQYCWELSWGVDTSLVGCITGAMHVVNSWTPFWFWI